jgi:hypothetical protein
MRSATYLKIAVAAALTAAATAVTPAAVAAPATAPATASVTASVTAARTAHAPAWHTSDAGQLSDLSALFDIASVNANSAWAVGVQYIDGIGQGVILHWNGRAWTQQSTPGLPETNVWHNVAASSAHDVWAYGWSQVRETLAHYDGKRWTEVPLPQQGNGFAKLAAVPGRVWLVNDTTISTYANGAWQSTPVPGGAFISAIEARTADDAWAVGSSKVLHWDGRSWTDVSPADSGLRMTDVYQESARSVWVTALTPYVEDEPQRTKVLHWNGRSWTDVTGPVDGLYAQAITGDGKANGKGTVWVSGDPYGYEGTAVYWRLRGGVWTSVAGDAVPGGQTQSYDVEDLAPIGRTGQFWSVGSYELITGESTSAQYELVQRSTR